VIRRRIGGETVPIEHLPRFHVRFWLGHILVYLFIYFPYVLVWRENAVNDTHDAIQFISTYKQSVCLKTECIAFQCRL